MVVASDADADAVERTGTYHGTYFILGGTVILGADRQPHLRDKELRALIANRTKEGLTEVILAFPANPEGDTTASRTKEAIVEVAPTITVTTLGRGLSTGSELEYADADTIKSAFESRH